MIAATLLYSGCTGVMPKLFNRNVEQFLQTPKTAFNLIFPNEVAFSKVTKLMVVDTDQGSDWTGWKSWQKGRIWR